MMMQTDYYRKILVAVDFSQHTQTIVQKAFSLQQKYAAEVELIHVVEIPIYPVLEDIAVTGMPGLWDEEITQQLVDSSKQKLEILAKQHDIQQYKVIPGLANVDIVDYSSKHAVDLIVMGAHGLSGIRRLIGSTANSVINHAQCDVLCVRIEE